MYKIYLFIIFFFITGLILGIGSLRAYTKEKRKNPSFLLCGISELLAPLLIILGLLLESEKLILSAFFFPITLFIMFIFIDQLIRYTKCNYTISAKYVSFTSVSYDDTKKCAPQFSFHYNGKDFLSSNLIYYPTPKFRELFNINTMYTIHINPHNPDDCVDKRVFPIDCVIGLIVCIIVLIIATIIVISI